MEPTISIMANHLAQKSAISKRVFEPCHAQSVTHHQHMKSAFDLTKPSLAEHLYPNCTDELVFSNSEVEELRRPPGHSPQVVRTWIRTVSEQFNVKPTSWAKNAGLAPSTLNRFINETDQSKNLSASTIERLANALVFTLDLKVRDHFRREIERTSDFFSHESVLTDVDMVDFIVDKNHVLIKPGEGFDKEISAQRSFMGRRLRVPVPAEYAINRMIGFDIATDAYDPVYPLGTIIICMPIFLWNGIPPRNANIVLAQHLDEKTYRTFIRKFVVDPSGNEWFVPLKGTRLEKAESYYLNSLDPQTGPKGTFLIIAQYSFERSLQIAHKSA